MLLGDPDLSWFELAILGLLLWTLFSVLKQIVEFAFLVVLVSFLAAWA